MPLRYSSLSFLSNKKLQILYVCIYLFGLHSYIIYFYTNTLFSSSSIADLEGTRVALLHAQKTLQQSMMELEATNQMLKDEHQALQVGFCQSLVLRQCIEYLLSYSL